MSVATIEPTATRPSEHARDADAARTASPVRAPRPRRSGPGVGPVARPTGLVPAPSLVPVRPVRVVRPQACHAEAAVVRRPDWRLTERGLAVVLVVAVLIVTAAVAVVALTALRVTSEGYHAVHGISVTAPLHG